MNKYLLKTWLTLFGIFFVLTGCFPGVPAVAINSGSYLVKSSKRDDLLPAAEKGDPEAQTELGLSYCCMGLGFSTQTATEWLCKAARQDYASAQYELEKITMSKLIRELIMKALVVVVTTSCAASVDTFEAPTNN